VTGASSGIGKGIAERLAKIGSKLVLAARSKPELDLLRRSIISHNGTAIAVKCDVTSQSDVDGLIDSTLNEYGQIDILINNAGVSSYAPVHEMDMRQFESIFAVNFFGLVRCTKAVLPTMMTQGSGKIINISSGAGKMGYAGGSAYCASKHAVNGFSSSIYQDLRQHGIQVHTVCPGAVNTSMMSSESDASERQRMLQVDDIADLVEFLATRRDLVSFEDIWTFSRYRG